MMYMQMRYFWIIIFKDKLFLRWLFKIAQSDDVKISLLVLVINYYELLLLLNTIDHS